MWVIGIKSIWVIVIEISSSSGIKFCAGKWGVSIVIISGSEIIGSVVVYSPEVKFSYVPIFGEIIETVNSI